MLLSIVVPVYNREDTIDRCIRSIVASGITTEHHAYEIVVVNDASTDSTKEKLEKWKKKLPYNLTLLNFVDHQERVIATNAGILQSQGEWVMRLDSDDELASHFKKAFEDMLDLHPKANIFHWKSLRQWRNKDGRYYRTDICPQQQYTIGLNGKVEPFKSGAVAFGSFAFKKSCLNVTGYLPQVRDPYALGKAMKNAHPELRNLYGDKDDLGNPWGDDLSLMFKLTREWAPYTIDQVLHYIHVRV